MHPLPTTTGANDIRAAAGMTTNATAAPGRPVIRRRRRADTSAWLFLLPSAAMLIAVLLIPLGYAIWLSLFDYDLGAGIYRFIGLGNYSTLLAEAQFWDSLGRT